jgi:hypothetical protein
MPELDPFDARLTAAVHAYADRAETGVDATAVAARAVGRRRTGAFAWLWSPLPVPAGVLLTLALLLALLAWTIQVGAPWDRRTSIIPPPAPTATPTAAPTSTPARTTTPTDGKGNEAVTGTERVSVVTYGTSARVGETTQMRGVVATTVDTMNDARVTGTGTVNGENDSYGSVGPQWGTYRLENTDGAWEGTWTGALWGDGLASEVAAWLVGTGAYKGYTYYMHARGTNVDGVIFMGSPPAPAPATQPATPQPATPQPATSTSTSTPAPAAPTDGVGAGYVVGTETVSIASSGTATQAGAVVQVRGRVAGSTDTMSDPRVTGTGTIHANADSYGSVASQWGVYRLENAGGAWEGTWTGALWDDQVITDVTGWLVGSGAYEGLTYRFQVRGSDILEVEGIIFPGSPPAP